MKRLLTAAFLTATELCNADQPVTLRLRVYDLAETTASAMTEVAKIFVHAGIAIEWEDGNPLNPEARLIDASVPPPAHQRFVPVNGALNARIVRHLSPLHDKQTLGFALPFARQGVHATLYLTNIAKVSRDTNLSLVVLLAAAMAHEIGHVLLGSGRHSLSGMMRDRWGKEEYRLAEAGRLRFTPDEAERMRRALNPQKDSSLLLSKSGGNRAPLPKTDTCPDYTPSAVSSLQILRDR